MNVKPIAPGSTFGCLTVIQQNGYDDLGCKRFEFKCACGNPSLMLTADDIRKRGRRACGRCTEFVAARMDPMALEVIRMASAKAHRDRERREASLVTKIAREAVPLTVGSVVGMLTITKISRNAGKVMADCSCGNTDAVLDLDRVQTRKLKSCGCMSTNRPKFTTLGKRKAAP